MSWNVTKCHQMSPFVIKCHHVKLKDISVSLTVLPSRCHQMSWNVFQFNMVTFDDMSWHFMMWSIWFREVACIWTSFSTCVFQGLASWPNRQTQMHPVKRKLHLNAKAPQFKSGKAKFCHTFPFENVDMVPTFHHVHTFALYEEHVRNLVYNETCFQERLKQMKRQEMF